jgi:acetyl esterase/lipase
MLRWFLLGLAVLAAALATLNVMKTPEWLPWRLGVLAGEFGHWLAVGVLAIAATAWAVRATGTVVTSATFATFAACVVAGALFLKPAFQAARIAPALREHVNARLPTARATSDLFSWSQLFLGRNPTAAEMKTFDVGGLPLDFYRATASSTGRGAPCVIVVHGGGWDSGDRKQLPHFNDWLAQHGYAVAAISYRLAPKHQWPAQRDDILAAITFLKNRATELRIDPTRLVMLGRSAGGQIALTVAYTANDPAIRGAVGFYAPSDLVFGYVNTHENDAIKSPSLMRQYLGGTPDSARANYESAGPLNHVTRATPPTLLLHGENDALAWYRHSVRLEARLTEMGVPCVFVSLPWATHAFDFNLHGPGGQLTTFALEAFLATVTAARPD